MLFSCSCARFEKAEAAQSYSSESFTAGALPTQQAKPAKEPSLTDSAIALLLDEHIYNAIRNYFGEPTQYALYDAKVNGITRPGTDFTFEITVSVPTFHGPHNPPYGLETMTFRVKPGGNITLIKYEHKDI